MNETATNPNGITEPDEVQEEQRLEELAKKEDKNDEETQELSSLKENKQTRLQKRIDKLSWRAKDAEERLEARDEELGTLRSDLNSLKKNQNTEVPINKTTVAIGEDKFYTDTALEDLVNRKELTSSEAYGHQQKRLKAEIKQEVLNDFKKQETVSEEQRARKADAEKVFTQYPQFSKTLPDGSPNPDYAPDDPLFKEASRLYKNGYMYNPQGLSQALGDAKKILKIGPSVDASDDLSVSGHSAPDVRGRSDNIQVTDSEKELAIRTYRDLTNPATGRQYTDKESIAKYTNAKKARSR